MQKMHKKAFILSVHVHNPSNMNVNALKTGNFSQNPRVRFFNFLTFYLA